MKVVELLKTLSEGELVRLEKFVRSPYYNENIDLIKLLIGYVLPAVRDQKTNKKLFLIKNSWSDQKFRKNCNELLELLIDFQTDNFIKSNSTIHELIKYQTLLACGWAEKFSNRRAKIVNIKKEKTAWTEIELAHYYIYLKSHIDSNSISIDESIRAYAEIAQTKKEFNKVSDLSSFIDLENLRHNNLSITIQHYRNLSLFNNYLSKTYKLVVGIFEGVIRPTDNQIEIKLRAYLPHIERNKASQVLDQITSFFITKINKGDLSVSSVIFNIYKLGIDLKLIDINVGIYRNIAYFACKENKFNWALRFVEKFKSELPSSERSSAYSFTKARTLWHAKDWDGVITTLRNVEYQDMTYNLLARSYILTCYYELDEFEPLDSLIKSFKVYLRRKRNVSKARKDSFYNFITALDHLMKASERNDYKRILKAKEVIENNPSTRNKDWLNEKIEELEVTIAKSKANS